MGNSHAIEAVLWPVLQWCGRLTSANALLLPTANVCVTFLWLRMRPVYRLVEVGLDADADAYSKEFIRWWTSGGAPKIRVALDRETGR
jgi:hypothetical protein